MAAKQTPPTRVRGNRTALLVIDVQQGFFKKANPVYNQEQVLGAICKLRDQARAEGSPVIYIQHSDARSLIEGSDDWQFHPALGVRASDTIIHKTHPDSFAGTGLENLLDSQDVGTLVITGLVSHGCVKATCLGAKKLGYRAVLVTGGHSNFSPQPVETIEKTEAKLAESGVELVSINEISFRS